MPGCLKLYFVSIPVFRFESIGYKGTTLMTRSWPPMLSSSGGVGSLRSCAGMYLVSMVPD